MQKIIHHANDFSSTTYLIDTLTCVYKHSSSLKACQCVCVSTCCVLKSNPRKQESATSAIQITTQTSRHRTLQQRRFTSLIFMRTLTQTSWSDSHVTYLIFIISTFTMAGFVRSPADQSSTRQPHRRTSCSLINIHELSEHVILTGHLKGLRISEKTCFVKFHEL